MNFIKRSLILFICLTFTGCVTRLAEYNGQKPDFSLTGEAANKEIARFRLEENNFWSCGGPCFERDPQKQMHTWKSVQPLLETVSPEAIRQLKKAEIGHEVQLYTLGIGLALLVAGFATDGNQSTTFFKASMVASLTSIASGLYAGWVRSDIPEIYNRDLKQKFAPTVGMNWAFE